MNTGLTACCYHRACHTCPSRHLLPAVPALQHCCSTLPARLGYTYLRLRYRSAAHTAPLRTVLPGLALPVRSLGSFWFTVPRSFCCHRFTCDTVAVHLPYTCHLCFTVLYYRYRLSLLPVRTCLFCCISSSHSLPRVHSTIHAWHTTPFRYSFVVSPFYFYTCPHTTLYFTFPSGPATLLPAISLYHTATTIIHVHFSTSLAGPSFSVFHTTAFIPPHLAFHHMPLCFPTLRPRTRPTTF